MLFASPHTRRYVEAVVQMALARGQAGGLSLSDSPQDMARNDRDENGLDGNEPDENNSC